MSEVVSQWKTKDGRVIDMMQMDADHMQNAFHHTTLRELQYNNKLTTLVEIKEQLLEAAKKRGIKLLYPDERFPSSRYGNYFANDRKNRD